MKRINLLLIAFASLFVTSCFLFSCSKDESIQIVSTRNNTVYPSAVDMSCYFMFDKNCDYENGGIIYSTNKSDVENGKGSESYISSLQYFGSGSQQRMIVCGLKPSTTYYYRPCLTKDGNVKLGDVQSFETLNTPMTTSNCSASSKMAIIDFGWNNSYGSNSNHVNFGTYGIQYSTYSKGIDNGSKQNANSSSTDKIVKLTNLSPNTKYVYRTFVNVQYYYEKGTVDDVIYGETKEFTTSQSSPTVSFTLNSTGNYQWKKLDAEGYENYLYSTNESVRYTDCTSTLTVNSTQPFGLSFGYTVSSYGGSSTLSISVDGKNVTSISGSKSGNYDAILSAGNHTITMNFYRGYWSGGNNRGYVYNIAVDGKCISNSDIK